MTENILHFSTDLGIGREQKPVALLVLTPDGKLTVGEGVTADELTRFMLQKFNAQIEALVLAEQDAKPVAWTRKQMGCDREYCETPFTTDWTPLYTAPPRREQDAEPVAWMDCEGDTYPMPEKPGWAPPHTLLYAAPPRREWQSLTVEERKEFAQWVHPDVLDSIEAALKAKNGGGK